MKVLIVTGGRSSERKISLISAGAVKKALENQGYQTKIFDIKNGYKVLKKAQKDFAVIFPVLHGKEGEDGKLYKFLKLLNKPYIGSHYKGAKIAFNKISHKKYCDQNKIPTAKWKIITTTQDIIKFGFPCVLKAPEGGSSREVTILDSVKDLGKSLTQKILNLSDKLYVEKKLEGIEVTAGILNNFALPLVEIIPPKDQWFDYKNKYSGETKEIVGAPSLTEEIKKYIQGLALKIHIDLNLGHYSRSDFIVAAGIPYILETNTPNGVGLTPNSLFPKAAEAIGLNFEQLVKHLVGISL